MRYLLLCLLVAGCADVTAPVVPPAPAPGIVFRAECPSVWDLEIDGARLNLYAFSGADRLRVDVTPGAHAVDAVRWSPTIATLRYPVTVTDSVAILLTC